MLSNMRYYMNLAVLALVTSSTVSPVLSAPTQYRPRYVNLHVGFKGQAFPDKWNPLG